MPRKIIDIRPHINRFGEYVDFWTYGELTNNRGVISLGNATKTIKKAAVFPENWQKLDFGTDGSKFSGKKTVFVRFKEGETPFPIANSDTNPSDTRMVYDNAVYRLVDKQPYTHNYVIYIAERMMVDPDNLIMRARS